MVGPDHSEEKHVGGAKYDLDADDRAMLAHQGRSSCPRKLHLVGAGIATSALLAVATATGYVKAPQLAAAALSLSSSSPLSSNGCLGFGHRHPHESSTSAAAKCPRQVDPINIGHDWDPSKDADYVTKALDRLRGSIRIASPLPPTQSYDDMGKPEDDDRFKPMGQLHAFLKSSYPRTYETLQVEEVAKYGLLYTWKGSDDSLKPIVLMAHQDVVPVNPSTIDRWQHEPFSGDLDDDGWVWGRGAADCKNTLIGILSAVEKLMDEDFEPRRTILLSFGSDEEIGGSRTAKPLAELILSRYGHDGIELIVDEGFTGVDQSFGRTFARLGMAEKGAVSVKVSVSTNGGHASVPPHHTGIGVLSRLLVELEDEPSEVKLEQGSPVLQYLQCAADYGQVDKKFKKRIRNKKEWKKLGKDMADRDPIMRAFLSTTQAINLVNGGIKVNALPEYTTATINYRIDFQSSVNETLSHIKSVLEPVVKKQFNMTFEAFESHDEDGIAVQETGGDEVFGHGTVKLVVVGDSALEPAPLTPASGYAFDLMSGTIKHVFKGAIVAPSGMIANTDTKWTWDLTRNIFRFVPASLDLIKGFHTVDERIHKDAHLTGIRFFYKLILNAQGQESD
ncbi:hypothetical protein OIV83_005854 [Microbotryomycetes sp. JL201]|nr:hypothetical protein OIV83_005854 [Microbotryomycetes sp. JL201]